MVLVMDRACPRCGAAIRGNERGRPARWCSQRCRRAAYEERRAAANGAIAVKVVEVVKQSPPSKPTIAEHVAAVLESPTATARVLMYVAESIDDGTFDGPRWTRANDRSADVVRAWLRKNGTR